MFTVVVISLAVSLLVVIAVSLAAFFNVAFREPVMPAGVIGSWHPPLLRRRELFNWAAAVTPLRRALFSTRNRWIRMRINREATL